MQVEMARAMSDDAARLMPTVDSHEDLAVVMGACTEEDAICVLFFDAPWSRKSAPLNAGLLELAREMAHAVHPEPAAAAALAARGPGEWGAAATDRADVLSRVAVRFVRIDCGDGGGGAEVAVEAGAGADALPLCRVYRGAIKLFELAGEQKCSLRAVAHRLQWLREMPAPATMLWASPERLRFALGDRVYLLRDATGVWVPGTVVRTRVAADAGAAEAPYQVRLDDGALALAPRDDDTAIQRKERMPLHDAVRAADAAQLRAAIARVVAGVARARASVDELATAMRAIDAQEITSGCTALALAVRLHCDGAARVWERKYDAGCAMAASASAAGGASAQAFASAAPPPRNPNDMSAPLPATVRMGEGAAPRDAACTLELVGALADAGADLRAPDYSGDAPVHYAARRGDRALVEALLARDARAVNAQTCEPHAAFLVKKGYTAADGAALATAHDTPLHLALEAGHAALARALATAPALDVNARNADGRTALHAALDAETRDLGVARALLARGADARLAGKDTSAGGGGLLHHYASRGDVEALGALIEALGARAAAALDERTEPRGGAAPTGGWTPLHLAARGGKRAACEALLAAGASAAAVDAGGRTPLELALANRRAEVVAVLEAASGALPPPPPPTAAIVAARA